MRAGCRLQLSDNLYAAFVRKMVLIAHMHVQTLAIVWCYPRCPLPLASPPTHPFMYKVQSVALSTSLCVLLVLYMSFEGCSNIR